MQGKTLFITGGNAGIGLETGRLFARHGANVAIFGRRTERNAQAKKLVEAEGGRCLALTGDVTKENTLRAALDETVRGFGALHFAFNNAGEEQAFTPLVEQTEEDYRRIMDINVKGVWLGMKLEIPRILASGGGCVVNTASMLGHVGAPRTTLYTASKHAVIGLTRSAAMEYAKSQVRVNSVSPGVIDTEMVRRAIAGNRRLEANTSAMHPMGRIGSCLEVATAVLYLCRDATWTTGQDILVDGGFTAC